MGKLLHNFNILFDHGHAKKFQIPHMDSLVKTRRQSVSSTVPKYAVLVKNVEYSYSNSNHKILNGLCMSVSQGSIYGLSGSSGSGKTTLISCILGTRSVDTGDIFLYGCNNTHPNRQNILDIPGKGVGFMPQELSLYLKLNVEEILLYFGRLYGMSTDEVVRTSQELLNLLQLSGRRSWQIELLSGGERRRVSFDIALVHSPKLLILDEPTVGMDPLLRIRVWDYLRDIVNNRQVTVIITSHYLDEMRKADKIGIMQNGQIVAENSPDTMLYLCKADSLDDVVLNLYKNDDLSETLKNWMTSENNKTDLIDSSEIYCSKIQSPTFSNSKESLSRIMAMTRKNIYLLLRNIPLFLFVICIPAFQLLTILLIGYEPYQLRLGVVNKELNNNTSAIAGNDSLKYEQTCPDFTEEDLLHSCELYLLSCRFLSHISPKKITLINIESDEDAILAVSNGNVYGYITFGDTFSDSLVNRALSRNENGTADKDLYIQYQITAQFDQSNTIIYRLMLKELYKSLETFLTSLMSACGGNRKLAEYPLQYQASIFGDAGDFSISDYVAPGTPIPFMFFFSIISSGLRLVEEKSFGTLDRMLISGVTLLEIMISIIVTDFFLITMQSSLMLTLLTWWLPMYNFDPFTAFFAFFLVMLAGCTGVSVGLLLGSICMEHVQVAIIAIAFTLPNIILSGIIWPIEAMPEVMQTVVQCLPCNLSSKALNSIWVRGMGISHPNVWPGVIILLAYILILNLLTVVYHKNVKK